MGQRCWSTDRAWPGRVSDAGDMLARVIAHAAQPRYHAALDAAAITLSGGIADCGDRLTVWLRDDGAAGWTVHAAGDGCSVSRGAASLLLERIQGRSLQDLALLDEALAQELVGAQIVAARPRCATLAISVVRAAARRLAAAVGPAGENRHDAAT